MGEPVNWPEVRHFDAILENADPVLQKAFREQAAYQDEYQRLWHEASAERDRYKRILTRLIASGRVGSEIIDGYLLDEEYLA